MRCCFLGLTQSAHRVVDVAGWAEPVYVDRPDNKLVLRLWYQAFQNHGVGLNGLTDVGPLCVHFWPEVYNNKQNKLNGSFIY